jgi:uncharacterized membrane-anchored protein
MKQGLKNEINNMLLEIPERNRVAINSIKWVEMTEEISKKYYLDDEEKNILIAEVALVLLGINDYEFFKIAMGDLGLTRNEISSIFREVEDKIFSPISKKIMSSIKKESGEKQTDWNKRIDFILSGGDYTKLIK